MWMMFNDITVLGGSKKKRPHLARTDGNKCTMDETVRVHPDASPIYIDVGNPLFSLYHKDNRRTGQKFPRCTDRRGNGPHCNNMQWCRLTPQSFYRNILTFDAKATGPDEDGRSCCIDMCYCDASATVWSTPEICVGA